MVEKQQRKAYANALLQCAQSATAADVVCFFLDQLRWCGLPQQADAIHKLESSSAPGVAALANLTARTITDPAPDTTAAAPTTRYAQLNHDLLERKPEALMSALFAAFADPDPAYAVAARRDTSGTYLSTLLDALAAASDAQKPVLLETASRIGGEQLLTTPRKLR